MKEKKKHFSIYKNHNDEDNLSVSDTVSGEGDDNYDRRHGDNDDNDTHHDMAGSSYMCGDITHPNR